MKFLITENKLERLIDNFLSEEYGGLIQFVDKNRLDLIFFIKDTGEKPIKENIEFFYNKDSQSAFIPWEMVNSIRMFTGDDLESKQYVMKWLKKTYGINPIKIYYNF